MAESEKAEPVKEASNVNLSQEQERVRTCQLKLQGIRQRLVPPADLRKINKQDITTFITDLGGVFAEVEIFKARPDKSKYFRSVDAASTKILEAINALNAASRILDTINSRSISMRDRAEGWDEFFNRLDKCQRGLVEALKYFK